MLVRSKPEGLKRRVLTILLLAAALSASTFCTFHKNCFCGCLVHVVFRVSIASNIVPWNLCLRSASCALFNSGSHVWCCYVFVLQCCRLLQKTDTLTISVWNQRKALRREGAGFMGCVRLLPSAVKRLLNVGCKWMVSERAVLIPRRKTPIVGGGGIRVCPKTRRNVGVVIDSQNKLQVLSKQSRLSGALAVCGQWKSRCGLRSRSLAF